MSWIWLDGVESFEKARGVRARKNWEPSYPQSYLVELIAQAGALLLGAESDFKDDLVFTKIEGVEFFERPTPEKEVQIEVEAEGLRKEAGWFRGEVFQEGRKLAKGRVLLMNVGRLRPDGIGPITFPETLIGALR